MRFLTPLLTILGALTLSFFPAAAPASSLTAAGAMEGNWELVLHAKTFPLTGDKPYVEKLKATAAVTDMTTTGVSSLTMTGLLAGFPFTLNGYRVGKHFFLFDSAAGVVVSLSGDAVVPLSTGIAKTLKGRGTLMNLIGMSDFTITGKRIVP